MEILYKILCVLAYNASFCVLVVNLRLILESYLTAKLNTLLEEKRIGYKAELLLERERWKEIHA
jgi:hypothetical protein